MLAIGAMTTYRDIGQSDEVHRALPVLAEAAHEVGDPQVRARGTLAGALAHADPAARYAGSGAGARRHRPRGRVERRAGLHLDSFFVDMLTTPLGERGYHARCA